MLILWCINPSSYQRPRLNNNFSDLAFHLSPPFPIMSHIFCCTHPSHGTVGRFVTSGRALQWSVRQWVIRYLVIPYVNYLLCHCVSFSVKVSVGCYFLRRHVKLFDNIARNVCPCIGVIIKSNLYNACYAFYSEVYTYNEP